MFDKTGMLMNLKNGTLSKEIESNQDIWNDKGFSKYCRDFQN